MPEFTKGQPQEKLSPLITSLERMNLFSEDPATLVYFKGMWDRNLKFKINPMNRFFFFLGPHLQHMEVPWLGVILGVKLELQLPASATATQDPSYVCDLHHSS